MFESHTANEDPPDNNPWMLRKKNWAIPLQLHWIQLTVSPDTPTRTSSTDFNQVEDFNLDLQSSKSHPSNMDWT
ncbi:hypothetical protein I79_004545 [Cricetulus griseus]|uniref:Uncharacterized protein n=1 Tax=Cricetulus griseus TaxID=10029 RepID=G3H2U3_CRIGR|nr:hypothetical protein I79_004545 [Cricetulus griseus]